MASGMIGWIEAHPDIALAGGAVGVLLIAGSFFKAKTPATGTSTTQDLSGLKNGIVYVPTQTSFTTNNRTQSGVFASNDPALTSVTTGPVNSPTTTKTTTTTTNTPVPVPQPAPGPCRAGYHYEPGSVIVAGSYPIQGGTCVPNSTGPIKLPPPPGPNPPPTTKSLKWDQSYTILGGDTLSAIAAKLTTRLRAAGMPGSMSVTWNDLWAHNTATITKYAQQHGFKTDYWNWIFPGETITVPRWA
jgi:hypothetical protein